MPAFHLTLAGIPLRIAADSAQLTDLLAAYFRYYNPAYELVTDAVAGAPPQCSDSQSLPLLHLTLELCDILPTHEQLLAPQAELVAQTGEIKLWRHATSSSGECFYFNAVAAAYHLDVAANRITGYVRPVALEFSRVLANTYTLFPLLLLLRAHSVYHLHAAAALSPKGKLCLFPASSRAGKTTLTTALGLAGWRPLADDSVLLRLEGHELSLTPLRKEFHLDEKLLDAWPALAQAKVNHRYFGRACVEALELFGTRALAAQMFTRVDAFILPQISTADPSRLEPLSASTVLLKLAEQSMFLQIWRDHTERQFSALTDLLQAAACYQFHSGPELLRDPLLAAAALRALD